MLHVKIYSNRHYNHNYKHAEFDYVQMFTRFNMGNHADDGRWSIFVFLLPNGQIITWLGCHSIYRFEWSVVDDKKE